MDAPAIERFWSKVSRGDGCWEWQGARDKDGYGITHLIAGAQKAHRGSFLLANGAIPAGLFVLHHCDNPACVRPDHLYAGTAADNARDCVSRGRNRRGESHGRSKLCAADVVAIRVRYAAGGVRQADLAREYAMPQTVISGALRGEIWTGATGPRSRRFTRLSPEAAAEIRDRAGRGEAHDAIAASLGVSARAVGRVIDGTTFRAPT